MAVLSGLVGCATTVYPHALALAPEDPRAAEVTFYRDRSAALLPLHRVVVYLGDEALMAVARGDFARTWVPAGRYQILARLGGGWSGSRAQARVETAVDLVAGRSYGLHFLPASGWGTFGPPQLRDVAGPDAEVLERELTPAGEAALARRRMPWDALGALARGAGLGAALDPAGP